MRCGWVTTFSNGWVPWSCAIRRRLGVFRRRAIWRVGLLLLLTPVLPALLAAQTHALQVGSVVMTVADMDSSVDFYRHVLTFEKRSDAERAGPRGGSEARRREHRVAAIHRRDRRACSNRCAQQ